MTKDWWVEKIGSSGKGKCIHYSDNVRGAYDFVKNYDLKKGEKLIIWSTHLGKYFSKKHVRSGRIINKFYDY